MAVALKMELSLGTKEGITSAVHNFLSGMSWRDCSKFNVECVTSWTHLFAERDVTYEPSIIDNFISFVDYMSCSTETYTSLGGSNGCADQLTNWDGTKNLASAHQPKRKVSPIEAHKAYKLERFAANCTCKSLSSVKM